MGESRWSFGSMLPAESKSAESEPSPQAGERFGPFELISLLGRGGMGVVYRARETASGREVALKLLSRKLSPSTRQRLEREGEVTAALHHPGIVKIHSAGEIEGRPYLAYELVHGARNLDAVLEGAERTERVRLLRDTARALGAAHAQGIVHRDVKPENVLVDANGDPRVVDFGLAWAEELDQLTRSGTLLGTPLFMAPEQLTSERAKIGPPTDVWALGVLLYLALTGEHPFDAESLIDLRVRVCAGDPTFPRRIDPTIPADLEAVCLKALALDPSGRYPSAGALADDLDNALACRPVSASSISRLQLWRLSRSPRVRALAAASLAALVLLALGGGISWATRTARHERAVRALLEERASAEALDAALASDMSDSLRAEVHLALAAAATSPEPRLEHGSRALELVPGSGRAQTQRGLSLLELGRFAEAAQALSAALAAGQPASLRAPLARALLATDRPQKAAQACAELLAERPDDVALLRLHIEALVRSGEVEQARATVKRLSAHAPGPSGDMLRAELALHTGADPQPFLNTAASRWPKAPAPVRAHANLLLGRGEAAAALHLLEDSPAAARDPELLALTQRLSALVHRLDVAPLRDAPREERLAGARWLLREGRREVALIERAERPSLHLARPAVAERSARARAALEAALALTPPPQLAARARLQLARLLGPASAEGREHLERGREALPDAPLGRRLLALRHLEDGDAEECLRVLSEGGAPGEGPALALLRGKALLALGRFADAVPELERVDPLRLDAAHCELLRRALQGAGRTVDAELLAERIRRLGGSRKEEAERYDENELNYDLTRRLRPHERLPYYRKLVELNPLESEYRAEVGKNLVTSGKQAEGFLLMGDVISRDPAHLVKALRGMCQIATSLYRINGPGALGGLFEGVPLRRERGVERRLWGYMNAFRVDLEGAGVEAVTPGLVALDAVLERDPAEITAYVLRALLHLRAGHLAQAERDLDVAEGAAPDCAPVHFYRALLEAAHVRPVANVARHIADALPLGYHKWLTDTWDPTVYPELDPYLTRPEIQELLGPLTPRAR